MPPAARLTALAAVLVLAGCAAPEAAGPASSPPVADRPSASARPSSPAPAAPTTASPPPRPSPTPTAVADTLRFSSTTVDGTPFDGASLAGTPALFWFWAPWCPTCRAQAEEVRALARDFEGRVAVVGVGSLDGSAAIEDFARGVPELTHLADGSGAVYRHFGVVQQSSFVLLDAEGRKVWSVGYGGSDELAEQVAAVAGRP